MLISDLPPAEQTEVICSIDASLKYDVPASILIAVAKVENGKVNSVNYNKNGSYDIGKMQINSTYLLDLKKYGITEDINGYKQNIIEQINFPTDKYELIMTQEKYIETHPDAEDLVKKINVKILYIFDGQERTIEVNKVKVKE